LFYIFSYHTFDFSAKKNFGTLKPPHENFLRTPLLPTLLPMRIRFTCVFPRNSAG